MEDNEIYGVVRQAVEDGVRNAVCPKVFPFDRDIHIVNAAGLCSTLWKMRDGMAGLIEDKKAQRFTLKEAGVPAISPAHPRLNVKDGGYYQDDVLHEQEAADMMITTLDKEIVRLTYLVHLIDMGVEYGTKKFGTKSEQFRRSVVDGEASDVIAHDYGVSATIVQRNVNYVWGQVGRFLFTDYDLNDTLWPYVNLGEDKRVLPRRK